jgi:peptidoglycan L-alanyl-D-glutamate endopeptidase CwlK
MDYNRIYKFADIFDDSLNEAERFESGLSSETHDTNTESILSKLDINFQPIARNFLNEAEKRLGVKLKVTEGYRDNKIQEKYWKKGRDDKGNIINQAEVVTNAKPGTSLHNYGLAIDVLPVQKLNNQEAATYWPEFGKLAKEMGLIWGGDFKGLKDYGHVQWKLMSDIAKGNYKPTLPSGV